MEFGKKLQTLRTREQLTQEALAEKLFVSRAAISKWESGRGYPEIDSLKTIAAFFHVTVDDLIGGDEIVALAEQDIRGRREKYAALLCGVLDTFAILLFLLPVFGNGGTDGVNAVSLLSLTQAERWIKTVFLVVTALSGANGVCTLIISRFDRPDWNRHRIVTGVALSIIGTAVFVLARQPYAGIFYLCLLVSKGFLLLMRK